MAHTAGAAAQKAANDAFDKAKAAGATNAQANAASGKAAAAAGANTGSRRERLTAATGETPEELKNRLIDDFQRGATTVEDWNELVKQVAKLSGWDERFTADFLSRDSSTQAKRLEISRNRGGGGGASTQNVNKVASPLRQTPGGVPTLTPEQKRIYDSFFKQYSNGDFTRTEMAELLQDAEIPNGEIIRFFNDADGLNVGDFVEGNVGTGEAGDDPGFGQQVRSLFDTVGQQAARGAQFGNFLSDRFGQASGNVRDFVQRRAPAFEDAFIASNALNQSGVSRDFGQFLNTLGSGSFAPSISRDQLGQISTLLGAGNFNDVDFPGMTDIQRGALSNLSGNNQRQFDLLRGTQLQGVPSYLRGGLSNLAQSKFDQVISQFGADENFQVLPHFQRQGFNLFGGGR